MAPEQITGEPVDARSDLFAAGAILFEMLAGRPAFAGRTIVEDPARDALRAAAGADRIAGGRRGRPRDPPRAGQAPGRPAGVGRRDGRGAARRARRRRRRRADAGARADAPGRAAVPRAAAGSRDRLPRLQPARRDHDVARRASARSIVRSSAVAARFAGETPDLKALAAEADVDRVVMGTLLRSGDQLRAAAQLVEAPGGTLLTSHTVQSSLGDLFQLQDDIARRVVEALSLPLSGDAVADAGRAARSARVRALPARQRAGAHLRRASPTRATSTSSASSSIRASRRRGRTSAAAIASSASTSTVAPDSETRAEDAFRRALALNPRLSIAHKFYANLEADIGQRAARPRAPARRGRAVTATTPSSSPGSSTPAATAACTSSPSPRTPRRAGSIRTCRPASSRRCS